MFDVAPSELLVLGTVALLVIPPKDLPKAMRAAGYWIGRARGVTRQFRAGFDNIIREAELAELEKKWAAENERIMREHPATNIADVLDPQQPVTPVALEQQPSEAEVPEAVDHEPALVEQPTLFDETPPAKGAK